MHAMRCSRRPDTCIRRHDFPALSFLRAEARQRTFEYKQESVPGGGRKCCCGGMPGGGMPGGRCCGGMPYCGGGMPCGGRLCGGMPYCGGMPGGGIPGGGRAMPPMPSGRGMPSPGCAKRTMSQRLQFWRLVQGITALENRACNEPGSVQLACPSWVAVAAWQIWELTNSTMLCAEGTPAAWPAARAARTA